MKQVSPWSVKNVEHEAREAAKLAARKAGTTLGVWLSQTILSTASEELKRNFGANGATPPDYHQAAAAARVSGNANRLRARPPVPVPRFTLPDEVVEQVQDLGERFSDLEERLSDTLKPMMRRVRRLGLQMEEVRYLAERMEDFAFVEDKVRGISHEVEKIRALQDQISELRRNTGGAEKIREIEGQIRELQRNTGGTEKIRELEQNLITLMHRFKNLAESGELTGSNENFDHLSEMIEEVQQTSQQRIAEQVARIADLAREMEGIKSQAASQTATGPLERAITRLSERVKDLEGGTTSGKGGLFG